MLGDILRYVVHHPGRAAAALAHPLATLETVHDRLVQRREYRTPVFAHAPDPGWERRLHEELDAPWPCPDRFDFESLWPEVLRNVEAAGVRVGPESFNGYNDGDAAFVRAVWCLVRHLKPEHVVETGVAHGFTSRFILEALARNGCGHLSSIDRPPLDPKMRAQIGIAVSESLKARWTLIAGSSQRKLPGLLRALGNIDLFVHDSLHTARNVRFEADRAWGRLNKGGALVIDDIDSNCGFDSFAETHRAYVSLVCEAEPVRPDTRRFNQKGLFGILLKDAAR